MLSILYNDFYDAKRSIMVFIILLFIPGINVIIRISTMMVFVINCIRLACFNDFKNRTVLFYNTVPISRNLYVLEKNILLLVVMSLGMFTLSGALIIYHSTIGNFLPIILFICGFVMFFCGSYIFVSLVFDPMKADFFNELVVSGLFLICGKLFIFDGLSIDSIILFMSEKSYFAVFVGVFSLIIFYIATCFFFSKKDL